MKRILFMLLLTAALASSVLGQGATSWNIFARPTESWLSGRTGNPAWNWMKAIDSLVAGSGQVGTGSQFYVDSNVSNAGDGSSWSNAVATLDEAVNLCTDDQGDTIYIAQGHTEAIGLGPAAEADDVDIDVDGVTIIQVGSNTISNGFDYTGDWRGAFAISGDNVTLENLRFHANVPDVNEAAELEANASNVSFIGCLFDSETPGTDEFFRCIKQDGANANQLTVQGCEFRMGAGAAECAIDLIDSDYAKILGNFFEGDYAVADVNNATTASIQILIAGNVAINGTVGGTAGLNTQPCIELKSDTSGVIVDNYLICNEATPDAALVGADMWVLNNWYDETEGGVSAAPMWLSTDTLENKIGIDDAANLGTTASVTADVDGSILERLEDLSERQLGTTLIAGKSYTVTAATASIIATTSPLFTIAGGPIRITDFVGIANGSIGNSDMLVQSVATAGPTTFPFSTSVTLDADPTGTMYTFTGAVPSVLTPLLGAQNLSDQAAINWYGPVGTIDQLGDAAVSGVIDWYMTFIPLVEGVTVTDAT